MDFVDVAKKQFSLANDLAGTVGEDVTRDALETMGLSRIPTARIIGKIDYKRAAYYFDPAYSIRQALLVDSKAEKGDQRTITIQISQTSLRVRMELRGEDIDEPGGLDPVLLIDDNHFLATSIFVKYYYHVVDGKNRLMNIYIVSLPNGMLQEQYNPSARDSFWGVGRQAPTRGEDFRVRVRFAPLKAKKNWRVQTIETYPKIKFTWQD